MAARALLKTARKGLCSSLAGTSPIPARLPHRSQPWSVGSGVFARWEDRVSKKLFATDASGSPKAEALSSSSAETQAEVSSAGGSELPWFVDPAYGEGRPTAASSTPPPPPPPYLPPSLHPLHRFLSESPFLDGGSVAYIDAKNEPEGMGLEAWTDWVVVAQLRHGRERGIRGAIEGVRMTLASLQLGGRVRVEGLENPASQWAMLDAGPVVVHIVTADAREAFDLEGVWTGQRRPQPGSTP